jgi:hypothetical protein
MTAAKVVAGLGFLAMATVLVYGFVAGDFTGEGGKLMAMPWGIVSLVDLYVGFVLFSGWILYRAGITLSSCLWLAAVMTLGSLAICLYVLVALQRSQRNWTMFFFGKHANTVARK